MNEAGGRVLRLRSKHSHRDSGFCGHWALKRGLIVGTRLCDSIDRRSFSPPLSLSLPLFHRTFFSFLFQPAVSFSLTSYSLYLPLQPPCDLPVYLGKQITAAGQELPNVSINIPVRPITTSDWAPADRTVHKWTTALIHSMLFYDKTEPNGFEMSHRLGADMWKWPISSIKDHYSFGV